MIVNNKFLVIACTYDLYENDMYISNRLLRAFGIHDLGYDFGLGGKTPKSEPVISHFINAYMYKQSSMCKKYR